MEINENSIFFAALGWTLIEFVWDIYLNYRQNKVQKKHEEIPGELIGIIPRDTFDKARAYAIDKVAFSTARCIISALYSVIFLVYNGLYWIWELGGYYIEEFGLDLNENEILQSAVFSFLFNEISFIISLPMSIYHNFVLEEKHGFNKQTPMFFIIDQIKSHLLAHFFLIPLSCGIVYIVKVGGEYFFLYVWLFVTVMMLFIYLIYPDFIAPLFDKYVPLPPGELRTEIERLATSLEFPLSDLYVVLGSKRSAHSNAYFYGFFKKKRIVLFDTLLKDFDAKANGGSDKEDKEDDEKTKKSGDKKKGCDNNEILAVLGHEMGHWKLNHTIKNIIIAEANLLIVFIIFSKLFKCSALYRAFGFYNSKPILIGLLIILQYAFAFHFALVNYLSANLSRRFEFEADRFAKSLGRANSLKKALIKLNTDNLSFPIYDKLYSAVHNSHPPLLERLQALDKED